MTVNYKYTDNEEKFYWGTLDDGRYYTLSNDTFSICRKDFTDIVDSPRDIIENWKNVNTLKKYDIPSKIEKINELTKEIVSNAKNVPDYNTYKFQESMAEVRNSNDKERAKMTLEEFILKYIKDDNFKTTPLGNWEVEQGNLQLFEWGGEISVSINKNDITGMYPYGWTSEIEDEHLQLMLDAVKERSSIINESKETTNNFIKDAFTNASKIQFGDKNYQEVMLAQRIAGPTNAGSSYEGVTADELKSSIFNAKWSETTHESVDAEKGYRVFTTEDLPKGIVGIADIKDMPENAEFYAIDPKQTGKISIGISSEYMKDNAPVTNTTYMITGPEMIDGEELQVVQTFHPGEPVSPSIISTEEIQDGTKLSKSEATNLGFDKCKFISPEMVQEYDKKAAEQTASKGSTKNIIESAHVKEILQKKQSSKASDSIQSPNADKDTIDDKDTL